MCVCLCVCVYVWVLLSARECVCACVRACCYCAPGYLLQSVFELVYVCFCSPVLNTVSVVVLRLSVCV